MASRHLATASQALLQRALLPLICLICTEVTSHRDVVPSHLHAWGYRRQVRLGAGWKQAWGWVEVRLLLGYHSGNGRADPGLTQISQSPLHLFPSDPWWAARGFPARLPSGKKIAKCFQELLKVFIFYIPCKILLCLFAYQFIFSLLVHLLYI